MATYDQPTENSSIESRKDVEEQAARKDGPQSSRFWLGEIEASKKREKTWRTRGSKVVARFRDERDMDRVQSKVQRKANILWSNTEILKGALYQGLNGADVRARFPKKSPKDHKAARQAALVLERALAATADDWHDEDAQIEACVEDMLLPGRGTGWIVYDADIGKVDGPDDDTVVQENGPTSDTEEPKPKTTAIAGQQKGAQGLLGAAAAGGGQMTATDATGGSQISEGEASNNITGGGTQANPAAMPEGETGIEPEQMEEITNQTVRIDHVYWEDYLCSAGRKDRDVWWKARGHDYSRDEMRKYWPEHADKVPLNVVVSGFDQRRTRGPDDDDTFKRARVWEIWDKSKKQRIYVAEGYSAELAREEDPYELADFFPTVEPLYGVKTTSTLTPIPEYTLYQDQAEELDLITTRLSRLINNLKRRGVYDASSDGSDQQLAQLAFAEDDQFLPYRGFAALMEKGGLKNVFQTEDLQPTIAVVAQLFQQRAQLVQTIYEITGISDVVRGASNPNETATAQRIKGQFGSLRLIKRQKRVQTFLRNLYRLKAEMIAEHFTREQLVEMTGIDMPTTMEIMQAKQQIAAIQSQVSQAQQSQQHMQQYQAQAQGLTQRIMQGMQAQYAQGPQAAQAQGAPAGAQPGQPPMATPAGQPGGALPNPLMAGLNPQMMQQQAQQQVMAQIGPPPQMIPMPQMTPEIMQQLVATAGAVPWEDIEAILRSDQKRAFKIDVQTDQTAQVDADAEKQQRMEFLQTMNGFMQQVMPAIMQMPQMLPLAKEMILFAVGAFKVGRTLEDAFSDTFDQLEKAAQQNMANPKPDPKTQLEQAKMGQDDQHKKMELAAQAQAQQRDQQFEVQKFTAQQQADLQKFQAEQQAAMQRETAIAQREAETEQARLHLDAQRGMAEFEAKRQEMVRQAELEQLKAQQADLQRQHDAEMKRLELAVQERIQLAKIESDREIELAKLAQNAQAEQARLEFEQDRHDATIDLAKYDGGSTGSPPASPLPSAPAGATPGAIAAPGKSPGKKGKPSQRRPDMNTVMQAMQDMHERHAAMTAQSQDKHAQMMAQHTAVLGQLMKHMTAPKRVVRDKTGRAVGVETVPNGPNGAA